MTASSSLRKTPTSGIILPIGLLLKISFDRVKQIRKDYLMDKVRCARHVQISFDEFVPLAVIGQHCEVGEPLKLG